MIYAILGICIVLAIVVLLVIGCCVHMSEQRVRNAQQDTLNAQQIDINEKVSTTINRVVEEHNNNVNIINHLALSAIHLNRDEASH